MVISAINHIRYFNEKTTLDTKVTLVSIFCPFPQTFSQLDHVRLAGSCGLYVPWVSPRINPVPLFEPHLNTIAGMKNFFPEFTHLPQELRPLGSVSDTQS
jgi:hypothetical protein